MACLSEVRVNVLTVVRLRVGSSVGFKGLGLVLLGMAPAHTGINRTAEVKILID